MKFVFEFVTLIYYVSWIRVLNVYFLELTLDALNEPLCKIIF